MRVKLLATEGLGQFNEIEWEKPQHQANEIEVKALLTGVCRSDIDMMLGKFTLLPLSMMGHEGLGQVTKIGTDITDVKVGDYVATRGEPAYADFYNVRQGEYVPVPKAEPKYILEPVACGINMIEQNHEMLKKHKGRLAILGTGFLAWVAYQTLKIGGYDYEIEVIGRSNSHLWGPLLKSELKGSYDAVVDLSSQTDYLKGQNLNDRACIVIGTDKTINQQLGDLIWKSTTISFASPRSSEFNRCMLLAEQWITEGRLDVEEFWTQGYARTNWQQAFEDAVKRPQGYRRGYIDWRQY